MTAHITHRGTLCSVVFKHSFVLTQVEVTTPEEHMGDVIGDLNSRRGLVGEFIDKPGNLRLIKASVPLSEMFQYVSTLRGMTKGRAQYSMQLEKYDVVPNHIQEKIVGAHAKSTA